MFISPSPLPFPTPASTLRRLYALEAQIAEATEVARLRREWFANEKRQVQQEAARRQQEAAAAAAREAQRAINFKQEAERAAAREIERAAEAEALVRDRPLFGLLLQRGRDALLQHLESEAASVPPSSVPGPPSAQHPSPEAAAPALHPPSSLLRPPADRAAYLENLLLHARHDIAECRRIGVAVGAVAQVSSWGAKDPPGGPTGWRELLLFLEPIAHDPLIKTRSVS